MVFATPLGVSRRVGGRLCLDFVNTVAWRGRAEPQERLSSYRQLVTWAERAGALRSQEAAELRRRAREEPERAEAVLERARELREAIYRLMERWSRRRAPSLADVATLDGVLESAPERRRLVWRGSRYRWGDRRDEAASLEAPLFHVAWSAADLLTSEEPERVKRCAADACGWLFYDASRARSRRWCSMSDCGNRAKARRHYARSRRGRAPSR